MAIATVCLRDLGPGEEGDHQGKIIEVDLLMGDDQTTADQAMGDQTTGLQTMDLLNTQTQQTAAGTRSQMNTSVPGVFANGSRKRD
jgi:hypothetical protein